MSEAAVRLIDFGARREILAFAALLALAAILRLPNLDTRGIWDADQGRHMLDLRAFVLDGEIPLLGPATSIGNIHHGALYYFVLAPAAFLSGGDPAAVIALFAWCGIGAVATIAWLARAIGGLGAGLVAGLLAAVSTSAVSQSTFIWNPNLVAFSSAIALASAWYAWGSGKARWWIVAIVASAATTQFHVLGAALIPIIGGLLIADARCRLRAGDRAGFQRTRNAAAAGILLGAVTYLPLIIHEVTSGGGELHAALAFLSASSTGTAPVLPVRIVVVAIRVLSWPLSGLITDAPGLALTVAAITIVLTAWLASGRGLPTARSGRADVSRSRSDVTIGARWLGLGLLWTIVALAIASPSLATVVPGLANDSYHAFADPPVLVLVGVGIALLHRQLAARGRLRWVRVVPVAVTVGLLWWNVAHLPPANSPDGGWAGAQSSARRIITDSASSPIVLASLPTFKGDEAIRMPLEAAGIEPLPTDVASSGLDVAATRVVLCDQLFRESIGADCGGPAEDALISGEASGLAQAPALVDRFEAAPGRWISVYRP